MERQCNGRLSLSRRWSRSLLVVAAAAALTLGLALHPDATTRSAQAAEDAQNAPDFELTSHDGETTVRLSDYRGQIVVLEWFNEECPFVVRHHKPDRNTMMELADRYAEHDVVWLAINSTSHATVESNAKIAEKWEITYPILDDSAGDVGRAYGARTTPHMYIIDAEGHLVYQGAIDSDPRGRDAEATNYVDQVLGEMLADETVTVNYTRPYGCTVKYKE
jgi:peroxiredoxin